MGAWVLVGVLALVVAIISFGLIVGLYFDSRSSKKYNGTITRIP